MTAPRWILHVVAFFSPRVRSNLAVDAGDIRRSLRDWPAAIGFYQRALRVCPDRQPIWVQLGHAFKENNQPDEALTAYRRACELPGEDGNAQYFLGVMAIRMGHYAEAKGALRETLRLMPQDPRATAEFLDLLHDPLAVDDRARNFATMLIRSEVERLGAVAPCGGAQVVFDASDLIAYFRHSRLPTGIQRVQMEVIRAAIDLQYGVQICGYSELLGTWSRIPADHFRTLCSLAVAGGDRMDPKWLDAIEILTAVLSENDQVIFNPGAFLINLGTSWWLQNYFLHVRRVQHSHGVHYVPFVHDFIPAITPEHCVEELTQDFLSWVFHVFNHADYFFVNSRSTRDDLHRVARILGHEVPASHVAVVPLDADFRRPELHSAPIGNLADWRLKPGYFALFVSTIESRKNHRIAFQAWRELIVQHGEDAVPDLVCVGNRGWLNDHVYAMLAEDSILARKVHMLSQLADDQLVLLYKECLFTIYPSIYEGWGLPVTESLCYGKVPILCRSSSLPEAGGDFALYFEPGDLAGLIAAVETLAFDTNARTSLEGHIQDHFAPRTWGEVATQISEYLGEFVDSAQFTAKAVDVPPLVFDRIYRITRNRRNRLASGVDEGEQLRSGGGWWEPEDWGCSTRPDGGELAFAVPRTLQEVRCWLRLRGPNGRQTEVTIAMPDRALRFQLPAGGWRWISFLVKPIAGEVRFVLHGDCHVDLSIETYSRDRRVISVGLGGVIVSTMPTVRSLELIAENLAERGSLAFLTDVCLLLLNRDINEREMFDFMPPLESGEMTRKQIIELFDRKSEFLKKSERAMVFD